MTSIPHLAIPCELSGFRLSPDPPTVISGGLSGLLRGVVLGGWVAGVVTVPWRWPRGFPMRAQGQLVGRCSTSRRAEATRAGTLMRWVRRVAHRALACRADAAAPAAQHVARETGQGEPGGVGGELPGWAVRHQAIFQLGDDLLNDGVVMSRVKELAGFRWIQRWGFSGRPGPGAPPAAGSRPGPRGA